MKVKMKSRCLFDLSRDCHRKQTFAVFFMSSLKAYESYKIVMFRRATTYNVNTHNMLKLLYWYCYCEILLYGMDTSALKYCRIAFSIFYFVGLPVLYLHLQRVNLYIGSCYWKVGIPEGLLQRRTFSGPKKSYSMKHNYYFKISISFHWI